MTTTIERIESLLKERDEIDAQIAKLPSLTQRRAEINAELQNLTGTAPEPKKRERPKGSKNGANTPEPPLLALANSA